MLVSASRWHRLAALLPLGWPIRLSSLLDRWLIKRTNHRHRQRVWECESVGLFANRQPFSGHWTKSTRAGTLSNGRETFHPGNILQHILNQGLSCSSSSWRRLHQAGRNQAANLLSHTGKGRTCPRSWSTLQVPAATKVQHRSCLPFAVLEVSTFGMTNKTC